MTKTVVFDFDGTLADTLPICYYAFQEVFRTYDKHDLSDAEIHNMFGPSEIGIIQQNLANQDHVNEAISLYYRVYADKHKELVKVSLPIIDLLADIKNSGYKIAIFTGKGRRSLDISLEKLEFNDLFDISVTGDDVVNPKPDPEGLYLIMKALDSLPTETVMVGDGDADVEAGKRGGVRTVRVEWLPNVAHTNFRTVPDYVISNVKGFLGLIGLM